MEFQYTNMDKWNITPECFASDGTGQTPDIG